MSMLKTKLIEFDSDLGKATYIYSYKGQVFVGEAQCHEDDMDMCSELVGLKYAETRAYLQYCKYRKRELQLKLEGIENLFKSLCTSPDFKFSSKYCQKIQSTICNLRTEINEIKQAINNIPPYLKHDMESREILYTKIREKRKSAN